MSVYVIAEAGVNHNGNTDTALALVDAAADAGADAVKFQTFRANLLAAESAPKAAYQAERSGAGQSQRDMLRALELSSPDHYRLADHCKARSIDFLSTPFDPESLRFLAEDMNQPVLKLGSGEITNGPLLVAAARTGCRIILSTGMSTLDEVAEALGALVFAMANPDATPSREHFADALNDGAVPAQYDARISLLHCTTAYPAPVEHTNLAAMATLADRFGVPVGFSDHTGGIAVAIAAVALGATIIEKHMTLDRKMPGPDHAASLEPDMFRQMTASIREIEQALGDGLKRPQPSEIGNMTVARKSLVTAAPVRAGDAFGPENLTVKRPGNGISPMAYWSWLGRGAPHDFAADEVIEDE